MDTRDMNRLPPADPGDIPLPFPRAHLPYPVVLAAGWSACILLVTACGWVIMNAVGQVGTVVAPLAIAVLLAAMLRPMVDALHHRVHLPRALAAFATVIALIGVVAAGIALVTTQVISGLPAMQASASGGMDTITRWFSDGPLHLTGDRLTTTVDQLKAAVGSHTDTLASGAVQTASTAVDTVAGILICLISLFFFLYQGEQIWTFLTGWLPRAGRAQFAEAFRRGWVSLGSYAHMQLAVAAINAVGIGIGAAVLGVPFVIPITVFVFLCSFVPIVGALLSGVLPALLALVDKGPVVAIIMVVIVIAVHQIEAHQLQPFLMGHAVALHPLAVIVVVACGTYLFGIAGALFAVPVTAMANSIIRYLTGHDPFPHLSPDEPDDGPDPAVENTATATVQGPDGTGPASPIAD